MYRSLIYIVQNFVSFYLFILKFYYNKLEGPVIMKHHVDDRIFLMTFLITVY